MDKQKDTLENCGCTEESRRAFGYCTECATPAGRVETASLSPAQAAEYRRIGGIALRAAAQAAFREALSGTGVWILDRANLLQGLRRPSAVCCSMDTSDGDRCAPERPNRPRRRPVVWFDPTRRQGETRR